MKRILALFCFVAIVFTLVSCTKVKSTVAVDADSEKVEASNGEIIKLLLSTYGDEETVGLNLPARNYVSVTANGYFSAGDLKFVSDNPEIATISYDSTARENCIYYKIEGVSVGKTTVHIESADGKVKSEDITVTVKEYISTTTQLTVEYKPEKTHLTEEDENYSYYRKTKTTTKAKETTKKTTKKVTTKATTKTTKANTKVTTKPTTKSTTKPTTKPTTKSTTKPTTKSTAKSTTKTKTSQTTEEGIVLPPVEIE